MRDMRSSLVSLRSLAGAQWGPVASEAGISALESALECRLPDDYRQFLWEFGWFESPDVTINGISGDENQRGTSAIDVMRWEQTESGNPLPPGLLPISNDGAGNLSCIVLSGPGTGTVVFVDHDRDGPGDVEPEAGSFAEWLTRRLRDVLPRG